MCEECATLHLRRCLLDDKFKHAFSDPTSESCANLTQQQRNALK